MTSDNSTTLINDATNHYSKLLLTWSISSALAFIPDTLAHPFHTVWTVQQTINNGKSPGFIKACQSIQNGGGFYTGYSVGIITLIPGTWLYLAGRHTSITYLGDNHIGQFMQGPFGIVAGTIIWAPTSRITRLQQASNCGQNKTCLTGKSTIEIIKKVKKDNGIRGFYRGSLPGALAASFTDAMGSWLQAQILLKVEEKKRKEMISQFFSSAIAFSISSILVSPIDVAVAALQIKESDPKNFSAKNLPNALKNTYRISGTRGFFKGIGTSMISTVLTHSIIPATTIINERLNHHTY